MPLIRVDLSSQADVGPTPYNVGPLEEDVGPEMYKELLAEFLRLLSQQIIDLDEAASSGNTAVARGVAHQLKGTAPCFGAVHLESLADRVLSTHRGDGDFLRTTVHEMDEEVRQLQAALG